MADAGYSQGPATKRREVSDTCTAIRDPATGQKYIAMAATILELRPVQQNDDKQLRDSTGAADAVEVVITDLYFPNDGFVITIAPTSKKYLRLHFQYTLDTSHRGESKAVLQDAAQIESIWRTSKGPARYLLLCQHAVLARSHGRAHSLRLKILRASTGQIS